MDEDTTEIVFEEEEEVERSQVELHVPSDVRRVFSKEKMSSVGSPSLGSSLTVTVNSDRE